MRFQCYFKNPADHIVGVYLDKQVFNWQCCRPERNFPLHPPASRGETSVVNLSQLLSDLSVVRGSKIPLKVCKDFSSEQGIRDKPLGKFYSLSLHLNSLFILGNDDNINHDSTVAGAFWGFSSGMLLLLLSFPIEKSASFFRLPSHILL